MGGTIESLQGRISYREYMLWSAYRNKYGPMNPVRMFDQPGAIVASQINNAFGGKAKPQDFLVYLKQKEEQEVDEVSQFMKFLNNGVKIGR